MDGAVISVIVVSLILSAFFSAMEVALTSSNKLLLSIDNSSSRFTAYVVRLFADAPANFLSSTLVGNNIALVVFSLFMSRLLYPVGEGNLLVETLVSSGVVIFTAEFLPKAIVRSAPNFYLKIFLVPAYFFYLLFYPVSRFCTYVSRLVLRIFGMRLASGAPARSFDMVDLQSLVEDEINSEAPTENEMKIFHNALDFSAIKVRECMVPRVEITALDIEDSIEELQQMFVRTKFSRIPIYRDTIDTIVGYASSRQLFDSPQAIAQMLREPIYVPGSGSAKWLLEEFIRTRRSLAIVIDEFGSTAGMVTTEDILEEIFGEIDDEHDADYLVEREVSKGEYLFSGRVEIEHINSQYGLEIPERDDYETLAGYVLYNVGEIPTVGESFDLDGFSLTVERGSSRRISLIRLRIIDN